MTYVGSVYSASTMWALGDIGFGSMAWLSLIAILFLLKPAVRVLKDYETQKKAGIDPVFNPIKAGITGADFWEERSKEIEGRSSLTKKDIG